MTEQDLAKIKSIRFKPEAAKHVRFRYIGETKHDYPRVLVPDDLFFLPQCVAEGEVLLFSLPWRHGYESIIVPSSALS